MDQLNNNMRKNTHTKKAHEANGSCCTAGAASQVNEFADACNDETVELRPNAQWFQPNSTFTSDISYRWIESATC
eukprot:4924030-Amphidinium_carterae.1